MSDTTGMHRKSYPAIDPDAPIYDIDGVQRRYEWCCVIVGFAVVLIGAGYFGARILRWWLS